MQRVLIAATAALMVSACNEQAPAQKPVEAPKVLAAGQYEGTWKVDSIRSVDRTTPATKLKQDATGPVTGCVAADGSIDAALFAEGEDKCTIANPYVRNGRIGMELTCARKGQAGEVRESVSGTFAGDSIDADVSTTTYLAGTGDYAMSRKIEVKRVGECAPAKPEKAA
ncbi:DUF3617 domain-containing protein [Sphingomonas daechungensis]|uniref:DUF3617 domain-containing protein n=1 Tax=Sphingomonas daechungensis TaxID=1176646 RepID=UPI003785258D